MLNLRVQQSIVLETYHVLRAEIMVEWRVFAVAFVKLSTSCSHAVHIHVALSLLSPARLRSPQRLLDGKVWQAIKEVPIG